MKLRTLALCLMLVLTAFQATGALAFVSAACEQRCLDDDERGRCADSCTDCACCFHPRPMARTASIRPAPAGIVLRAAQDAPAACATAPPGEILHVPIAG